MVDMRPLASDAQKNDRWNRDGGRKSKGLFATNLSHSCNIQIILKYIYTTQYLSLSPACFGHVFMADCTRHFAQ